MISSVSSNQNYFDLAMIQRQRAGSTDDSTSSTSSTDETRKGRMHGRPPGPPPEAVDAAANLLGMSSDDVKDALSKGTTLADLATTKGVSDSDLLAAVTGGLEAGAAKHGMNVSDQQITDFATNLINGTRPTAGATGTATGTGTGAASDITTSGLREVDAGGTGRVHGHGHHGPPQGPPPAVTESVADLLGMSESDLLQQLQSGTSLKDIAAAAGVSEADLTTTVKGALTSSAPDGVTPTDNELSDFANRIVNSTAMRPADDSAQASSGVRSAYKSCTKPADATALSSSLKLDVTQLLQQLKSGTHVSDIAAAQGVSTDDLFSSLLTGMLADTKV